MKTISEVIGTADLFAEIQQIHEFAAFRNVESRDLTAWFLAYHACPDDCPLQAGCD